MAVFWKTCTASEIYLLLRKRTDAPVIFLFQKKLHFAREVDEVFA